MKLAGVLTVLAFATFSQAAPQWRPQGTNAWNPEGIKEHPLCQELHNIHPDWDCNTNIDVLIRDIGSEAAGLNQAAEHNEYYRAELNGQAQVRWDLYGRLWELKNSRN